MYVQPHLSGHSTALQEQREHFALNAEPERPILIPCLHLLLQVSTVIEMFSAEEESYLTVPEIEPVKTFLANALNLRLNGDKTQYELIVDQMRVRDDPETLWKILVALCSFTYQLTKQ